MSCRYIRWTDLHFPDLATPVTAMSKPSGPDDEIPKTSNGVENFINYGFCGIELQLMQSNSCAIEQLFRPLISQLCAIECLPPEVFCVSTPDTVLLERVGAVLLPA